jgi:hypothetical protein
MTPPRYFISIFLKKNLYEVCIPCVLHVPSILSCLISQCPAKDGVVTLHSIIAHGGQIHGPVLLVPAIFPRYALNRKLDGPENRPKLYGEQINLFPFVGSNHEFSVFQPAA